mmetsp:Transcript_2831/g.7769  ORF Transcript_2831/g.7769 Transcript_2831/m.7769 type:complete len:208 (-) Transcript_2831:230-853(-)
MGAEGPLHRLPDLLRGNGDLLGLAPVSSVAAERIPAVDQGPVFPYHRRRRRIVRLLRAAPLVRRPRHGRARRARLRVGGGLRQHHRHRPVRRPLLHRSRRRPVGELLLRRAPDRRRPPRQKAEGRQRRPRQRKGRQRKAKQAKPEDAPGLTPDDGGTDASPATSCVQHDAARLRAVPDLTAPEPTGGTPPPNPESASVSTTHRRSEC